MLKAPTKAVIPVAGLGTRFLPATKAMPKEMLPLVDKPVIQYVVEEAVRYGLHDILFVTGRDKYALENHFDTAEALETRLEEKGDDKKLALVQKPTHLGNIHYGSCCIRLFRACVPNIYLIAICCSDFVGILAAYKDATISI